MRWALGLTIMTLATSRKQFYGVKIDLETVVVEYDDEHDGSLVEICDLLESRGVGRDGAGSRRPATSRPI